ncbi:hypothetical protein [Leptospira perolatii]|uniref:hypothetical protein n=1 Tax=Leptospira perolatii TaxID=2023191 RepID=UPI000F641BC3|nr:hypothetical protein [Leptospira perolatii]
MSAYQGGALESENSDQEPEHNRSLKGFSLFLRKHFENLRDRFRKKNTESTPDHQFQWENPFRTIRNGGHQAPTFSSKYREFSKRLARNILIAFVLIGIIRTCFFPAGKESEKVRIEWEEAPPDQQQVPQEPPPNPPSDSEEEPQYQI